MSPAAGDTHHRGQNSPGRNPAHAQVKCLTLWTGHLGTGSVVWTGGGLRTASHDATSLATPVVGTQTAGPVARCLKEQQFSRYRSDCQLQSVRLHPVPDGRYAVPLTLSTVIPSLLIRRGGVQLANSEVSALRSTFPAVNCVMKILSSLLAVPDV